MVALPGKPVSLWQDTVLPPSDTGGPPCEQPFCTDALDLGTTFDVVVIGGGIVGVTAAYILKKADVHVCLLENRTLGSGTTGRSTAKVTSMHGLIYNSLSSTFGDEKAGLYGMANQEALEWMAATVAEEEIDCDFLRLPAYIYTNDDYEMIAIEDEIDAAQRAGLPASYVFAVDLPVPVKGAMRFEHQAQFHPLKYLQGLARTIPGNGCVIHEHTRALDVEHGDPCLVKTDRGDIRARHVIVATHLPFLKGGLYFARTHPLSHPSLAFRVEGPAVSGMYLGPKAGLHSLRSARVNGETYLVSDTPGYKTGHAESVSRLFQDLAHDCGATFPVTSFDYRWEAHDYHSADRIPFVGRLTGFTKNVYVATGFGAWGMTNGTAAALRLSDIILKRSRQWSEVFDSTRKDLQQVGGIASQALDATRHVVLPRVLKSRQTIADVAVGAAKRARLGEQQVAVSRDRAGTLHGVKPTCGHMGCQVRWNDAEETWDCPCHGSRYEADGVMRDGPTKTDLFKVDLSQHVTMIRLPADITLPPSIVESPPGGGQSAASRPE